MLSQRPTQSSGLGGSDAYVEYVSGTPLADAVRARQALVTMGGTSAGCDYLSDFVFAPEEDAPSITSSAALKDPYTYGISFADSPFELSGFGSGPAPGIRSVLADTHFEQRDLNGAPAHIWRSTRGGEFYVILSVISSPPTDRCCMSPFMSGRKCQHRRLRAYHWHQRANGIPRRAKWHCLTRGPHLAILGLSCAISAPAPTRAVRGSPSHRAHDDCTRIGVGSSYDFSSWKGDGTTVAYSLSVTRGKIDGRPYGP